MGFVAGSNCLVSGTHTWTTSRNCLFSVACVGTRLLMPCRILWPTTWNPASLSPRQVLLSRQSWYPGSQGHSCFEDHLPALSRLELLIRVLWDLEGPSETAPGSLRSPFPHPEPRLSSAPSGVSISPYPSRQPICQQCSKSPTPQHPSSSCCRPALTLLPTSTNLQKK